MDSLKDWRFWIGSSILGYLILAHWSEFNTLVQTGFAGAEHYTQILQGRTQKDYIPSNS